jgi:hypothetical protein
VDKKANYRLQENSSKPFKGGLSPVVGYLQRVLAYSHQPYRKKQEYPKSDIVE